MSQIGFSGSYTTTPVSFLLNPLEMEMTSVDKKEELIQSGQKHYSEMLSKESAPSAAHLDIFQKAHSVGAPRMAAEVEQLADKLISHAAGKEIVLASLVRAGLPMSACLTDALLRRGADVSHYGISIIRDRGLDAFAMDYIESRHDKSNIYFVDGWTGKGAISNELKRSLDARGGYPERPQLVVLADPCGKAWMTASYDDWLIPFGIMGAPISGLVSRSVWQENNFHGCVIYDELREFDYSQQFVDDISKHVETTSYELSEPTIDPASLKSMCDNMVADLAEKYNVDSINRIKPGVAEATRAVMRRVPEHVLIKDINDPDVALLLHLTEKAGIAVKEVGDELGNFKAVTIIKKVS